MHTRFLDWYFTTGNPNIVAIRTFVRKYTILRVTARASLRIVRAVIGFFQGLAWRSARLLRRILQLTRLTVTDPRAAASMLRAAFIPIFDAKTRAIIRANAIGGSLSLAELEQLWSVGRRCRRSSRVLCIAAEPEFRQVDALLKAAKPAILIRWLQPHENAVVRWLDEYDLVVLPAHESFDLPPQHKEPPIVLRFRGETPPGKWGYRSHFDANQKHSGPRSARNLLQRLHSGEPIDVLLLNDIGFQYGAGSALRRQASSFLLNGWNVVLAARALPSETPQPQVTGIMNFKNWQGSLSLHEAAIRQDKKQNAIDFVVDTIEWWKADVIVAGNLHGTGWPIEILPRLRSSSAALFAYMHDVYWITGRCAQPGTCTLFRTGCTAMCPTAREYPRLTPDLIPDAWQTRAKYFSGPDAIPLIANSHWTESMVRQRFGRAAHSEVVHLALDHHLFRPIPKSDARRLLGLPEDKTLVVMGAVDVMDRWKGGPLFDGVHKALTERNDAAVVLFGHSSDMLASVKSFGMIQEESFMSVVLGACDIFVSCAIAESFGQTLLEASACGLPVVAFNIGGVSDIIAHERTGLLVDQLAVEPMLAALDSLIADAAKRQALGRRARERVENEFTLVHQARAWRDCIQRTLLATPAEGYHLTDNRSK